MAGAGMAHELRPKSGGVMAPTWYCSCGKWEMDVPARGPFGTTSLRGRMAQVRSAHGLHVKWTEPDYRKRKAAARADAARFRAELAAAAARRKGGT